MKARAFSILLVTLMILVSPVRSARAQSIVTIPLAGKIVGNLIEQFEETANRILQNAGQQGDILGSKFGNELRVATRNLDIALAGRQQEFFEDLSLVEQSLFTELNRVIETANRSVGQAARMAEVANLNLIEFTNRLPLTEKLDFYLSSIQGLTQPHAVTPYNLVFRGIGFAFPPGDRRYEVTVLLNGTPLPANAIRPQSATDLMVEIPNAMLESRFSDTSTVQVPMILRSKVAYRKRRALVFSTRVTKEYEIPFTMSLLPRFPGTLTGTEPTQAPAIDPTIRTTSVTHHTQGCRPDRPCDWSQEVRLADDEVAVGVRYACSGQCGWDYNQRRGGYDPDFDILEDGKKVVVYRHNDGAQSTTVTHYIDFKKRITQFQSQPIGPLRLEFGKTLTINLRPENQQCAYELRGSLVTKQTPYLDSGMTQSADGLLVRTGISRIGDRCVLNVVLNQP